MKVKEFAILEPTIGAMWASYRANVLEPSGITGGLQLQETRRTFYAACGCLLNLLAQMPQQLSEEGAAQALADMGAESFEFMVKVMAGREGY
jgi:hypothetical protein